MAQSFARHSSVSSPPMKETVLSPQDRIEKASCAEEAQEVYVDHKDRLLNGIDATRTILGDMREFNKERAVRFPRFQPSEDDIAPLPESPAPKKMRRSMTFADDPKNATDVVFTRPKKGMRRSLTLASVADKEDSAEPEMTEENDEDRLIPPSSDFHVLRLDLKLGAGRSTESAAALVTQLEKASISNLLDDRIEASINHLDKLHQRVEDTSSKVLVTGDLNAGKSTFVNALLRREVLPVDQQPCTTMFCEVHDAKDNDGVEEVHVMKEGITYCRDDESTFTRAKIADLDNIISEAEGNVTQGMLKLYVKDARQPSESLLHNGIVDIALIDAPGLNRDSLKTTAVFARQEEIDVVVFVVSAENHFTLSAKEFLWNASNEKAYLFIVVNRFDQIKNKEKCKRLVLEQIKQLSPRTFEDAEDLVHFVDSSSALHSSTINGSFDKLEQDLRSFVLTKRSKSKLAPASTYLTHVLSDIELLAGANAIVAQAEREQAEEGLKKTRPVLEKLTKGRDGLDNDLVNIEETCASRTTSNTKTTLSAALDKVGNGQSADASVSLPEYPGLLGVWDYATEVRRCLLASIDKSVKSAEDVARSTTAEGVNKVHQLADSRLPEGVERSRRIFRPEAMFSPRAGKGNKSRRYSGAVVAGGTYGLGLGLAHRPELLEVSFFDIFDVKHQLSVHFGTEEKSVAEDAAGALSVVSLGAGALTMVGGKALGVRGVVEGIVRISDFFGDEKVRKWVAPVIGAVTFGATLYLIYDLPHTIPRNAGRRIKASLEVAPEGEEGFIEAHANRIARETRKVLRIASWDLQERYRGAIDNRAKEVQQYEAQVDGAAKAVENWESIEKKTGEVRSSTGLA